MRRIIGSDKRDYQSLTPHSVSAHTSLLQSKLVNIHERELSRLRRQLSEEEKALSDLTERMEVVPSEEFSREQLCTRITS